MKDLKLHSFGRNDYLEVLRKNHDKAIHLIQSNNLTEDEKSQQIQKVKQEYERERKKASQSLF